MKTRLWLITAVLLCHCRPPPPPADTLTVALDSEPKTLDPRTAVSAVSQRLAGLLFHGLVKPGPDLTAIPDGAESWSQKDLTYTFVLKKLTFSNGRSVTKEDLLFSFEEFQKKTSPFYSAFKNIKSVRVYEENGKLKIQISLKKFSAVFLSADLPIIKILPKKEAERPDFYKNPVGTGAFKLKKKTFREIVLQRVSPAGTEATQAPTVSEKSHAVFPADLKKLQGQRKSGASPAPREALKTEAKGHDKTVSPARARGEDYQEKMKTAQIISPAGAAGATPSTLKQISFLIIRDTITRIQRILAGDVDIAPSVIPPGKVFLFAEKGFQVFSAPGLSTAYLLLNLKNPYLKNREVRAALSRAVHREEIIKYKLKGFGRPAAVLIPPQSFFFNDKVKNPPFNPEKARETVRRLGLSGARLSLACSNNPASRNKGAILAGQLNQTGLNISLETAEWGVFYDDLSRGQFDMAFLKWVGVQDPDIYNLAFHSENHAPKGRNRSFYSNKALDDLLEKGLKEKSRLRRKKIYDRIQNIISRERVVIPLWHNDEITIVKKGIKNYFLPENGDFSSLPQVIKSSEKTAHP